MKKLFGTDGIRGLAGRHPFEPDFVRKIGFAAAKVSLARLNGSRKAKPSVIIGMDSRGSGPSIKAALAEGLAAGGFEILDLGLIPTPAVSYLVKREGADLGVVISASHNPPEFNGIKFFSAEGLKLSDADEASVERLLASPDFSAPSAAPGIRRSDFSADYEEFLLSTLPAGFSLKGVKVVLDCANGAASELAPRIFKKLGAEIRVLGASPDGTNINVGCGALETGPMRAETAAWGAWCGVSFDGDADRCMLSDEKGRLLDGDDIISIAAPHLKAGGRLRNSRVVLTLMSNCGLIKHLHSLGIGVTQVAVGDKNVTEAIEKEDLSLGGESSGHTIFREFAPTGDGLLTALQVLAAAREDGRPMSAHAAWKRFPQEVRSLKVESKPALETIPGFPEMIAEWERRMGGEGRIFVRYSGTEPLLRVLVEGEDGVLVKEIAEGIIGFYGRNSGRAAAGGARGGAQSRDIVEGK